MSSFWDWEKKQVAAHNEKRPYAPENGSPLKFKPGDSVIYTHEYLGTCKAVVSGYYLPTAMDSFYAQGARYLLDRGAYWFPVKESELTLDKHAKKVRYFEAKSYWRRKPDLSHECLCLI